MPAQPTPSDFVALERKLDTKLDRMTELLGTLARLEERQTHLGQRFGELVRLMQDERDQARRKVEEMERDHLKLRLEVHGYVQRWAGAMSAVSLAIGAGWAVVSKLFL